MIILFFFSVRLNIGRTFDIVSNSGVFMYALVKHFPYLIFLMYIFFHQDFYKGRTGKFYGLPLM